MKAYTYAQSLCKNELKGYHFAVQADDIRQYDGWLIANIEFSSVNPKNKKELLKEIPICNITLFQLKEQMKFVHLVAKIVKERQEIILQFKPNPDLNAIPTSPAANSQYMFSEDLLSIARHLFNGIVIEEGKCDFFTLVEKLDWASQKAILQKQRKSLSGMSWGSIALYGVGFLVTIGLAGAWLKKKQ